MTESGDRDDVSVLEFGARKFVTGLRWQNMRSSARYMDEAREFGREHQMDIVAIRVSKVIQAGFVSKSRGVARTMYSLAAVLIDTLGPSWLAGFDLGDGRYYLVAADKDAIIPDSDFIGSHDEAVLWARSLASQFGWTDDQIIRPDSWAMGGREETFESVMSRAEVRRSHRLKALPLGLAREEWLRLGVSLVGVSVVIGVGWFFWDWYAESQRAALRQEARVKADALARLNAEQARLIESSSLTRPWTLQPLPLTFARMCERSLLALPLSIGGWVFDTGSCSASSYSASYRRSTGSTNLDYRTEFEQVFPGGSVAAAIQADDEVASFSIRLVSQAGGDEGDQIRVPRRDIFVSHFQAIDHKLQIKQSTSVSLRPEVLPNGQPWPKDLEPPRPFWLTFKFAFDSATPPSSVLAPLGQAGYRIDTITTRLEQGNAALTWHTNGDIYVGR